MINRFFLLFVSLTLLVMSTLSQESYRTISGVVTSSDEATPLEGVTVYARGSNKISGSQPDGSYFIQIGEHDSVLVFSYAEYVTEEIRLASQNECNIALRKLQDRLSKREFSFAGNWRGVFQLTPEINVPINFQVVKLQGKQTLYFLNGDERFETGAMQQTDDSIFVALEPFDNELVLGINNETLSGFLRKKDRSGRPIPVTAEKKNYRFQENNIAPAGEFSGTYDIVFNNNQGGAGEKAVGLFTQRGNKLTATFLRVTGDSRYLEGVVEGNNFYLSSFIGSSPAYYKGSFTSNGQLNGEIIGARGRTPFSGTANENASLPDPYKLTYLKEGYSSLDFAFPDVNGTKISLKDKKYNKKVVILTITGTWCPNCIDEAYFLAPWFKQNHSRGVEAIAIHYERQTDSVYVRNALERFRKKFDIQYEQVIAGTADKQLVAASLPALNTFLSFPTIIIISKKGKVAKIHTGFSGPATGKYYEEFVKEFNDTITTLVNE
jgi:peroxiredoxin